MCVNLLTPTHAKLLFQDLRPQAVAMVSFILIIMHRRPARGVGGVSRNTAAHARRLCRHVYNFIVFRTIKCILCFDASIRPQTIKSHACVLVCTQESGFALNIDSWYHRVLVCTAGNH